MTHPSQNTPLPPVDDLPILADAKDQMVLEIGVGSTGEVYIFHSKPFQERINWVEYDAKSANIYFISEHGRVQNMGIKIFPKLEERMKNTKRVFMFHVEDGQSKSIVEMPMIFQQS